MTAERLDGWKAIAEYTGRNARTVQRWALERGFPIHHVPGGGAVFAWTHEIDQWFAATGESPASHLTSLISDDDAGQDAGVTRHELVRAGGRVLVAALGLGALAAVTSIAFKRTPPPLTLVRFAIEAPQGLFSWPRISPDGRAVAFGAELQGRSALWVRALAEPEARPLAGVTTRETAFWSPDGRHLGYFDQGALKVVTIETGEGRTLAAIPRPRGGAWSRSHVILFGSDQGIFRIGADGSGLAPVTTVNAAQQDVRHGWPAFLPDGRRFLVLVESTQPDRSGVYLASLESGLRQRLLPGHSRATYAPGYLLFARDGQLQAQPFDERTGVVQEAPETLVAGVKHHAGGDAAFDVSETGVLVFRAAERRSTSRLLWVDRSGRELGALGAPSHYGNPRFSPDGRRVAVQRWDAEGPGFDIWVFDPVRRDATRLTAGAAPDINPVWSPDGWRLAFSSKRGHHYEVYVKTLGEAGDEALLLATDRSTYAEDWSRDGLFLSALVADEGLRVLPLARDEVGQRLRPPSAANPGQSCFSPDGRFVAYASAETGDHEIYVEPRPATGARWQVSAHGGTDPAWRADGRELFYVARDGMLTAVPVASEATLRVGSPVPLFHVAIPEPLGASDYAVAPDGQSFVVNSLVAPGSAPPVQVVVNWTAMPRR